MKIVVLAGGLSPERDVSLTSGSLIANALIEKGHRVCLLDLYRGMRELPADMETLFTSEPVPVYAVSAQEPNLDDLRQEVGIGDAWIGPHVEEICRLSDRVFLALHGAMGENGQLQAYLDSQGIRYTGSGYAGCLLAMDKELSKRLFRDAGIPTPPWVRFDTQTHDVDGLIRQIGLPCVVKPNDCGSSVGVSIVETREALQSALSEAAKWGRHVLVEKKVTGRELTVGVLDGRALPPVEIIPESGFYDYQNKYTGKTREICPAQLPQEVTDRLSHLSLAAFDVLRLLGYARFDYILDADGTPWCLEANALPGMTPTSLLPQEAAAVGISYADLCETILRLSDLGKCE